MGSMFTKKLNWERGVAKGRSLVSVRVCVVGRDNGRYISEEVWLCI